MKIVDGVLMVHGSQARTVTSPGDIERLRAQGWLVAQPKPKTAAAAKMRATRQRRIAEGWRPLQLWMAPGELACVDSARLPGETYVELFLRLLNQAGYAMRNSEAETED